MPPPITDPEEIRRLIREHGRWFHSIELAPGIVTPGEDSNQLKLPILDELGLPRDCSGMRALDIGCADGYFSFELEKRGAQVLAIEFVPAEACGFAVARRILGSTVEFRMDNVYNLNPTSYGTFDIVLFLGVLYHLRKPLAAIDAIRSVCRLDTSLFLATLMIDDFVLLPSGESTTLEALSPQLTEIPLWQAYPADSLNGDFTNCFAPNLAALRAALEEAQFEVTATKKVSMGGYVHARATNNPTMERFRKLDSRLESETFDPEVPYFLDTDRAKLTLTGRGRDGSRSQEPADGQEED